jgi:hypothetical protein
MMKGNDGIEDIAEEKNMGSWGFGLYQNNLTLDGITDK